MSHESAHLQVSSPARYKAAAFACGLYLKPRGVYAFGTENIPIGSAPYILAANHRSMLDVPVLGISLLEHDGSQVHFAAKKELWKHSFVGLFFEKAGGIKYDRDKYAKDQPEAMQAMTQVLQNNGVLGLFPEHTRRSGPNIQVEKRGLGMLAVGNMVPILPVGIAGTESKKGPVVVVYGPGVEVGPLQLSDNRKIIARIKDVESEYVAGMQDVLDEANERRDFMLAA